MERINPKYIRIAIIFVFCIITVLFIAGIIIYNKREAILQHEITKAKLKAKADYKLNLKIGSARFSGLSTIAFSDITIVPIKGDSLLSIKRFEVGVKLWPLLTGNIKLAEVKLKNAHLNLTDINNVKNFDFFLKKKKDTTADTGNSDLGELANNLINQVLFKIPDELDVSNFTVSFKNDSASFKILTQKATITDSKMTSTININDGLAIWHFNGIMRPSDKNIDVKLFADGKKVELPFIEKRFHLKVNFDTLSTRLSKVERGGGETRIYGSWHVRNLLVSHPGLSTRDIIMPDAGINANVFIGQHYVSIDSSSTIQLKKITFNPFMKYTLLPIKVYELKVNTGWLDAQSLFDSFPIGLFDSLEGMKVEGKLNYKLNISLSEANPDDVVFSSGLEKNGFKIIRYGKTDLTTLNNDFVYTPYEKMKPMPPRMITVINPNFTKLANVAPDLKNAVLTAEDPSFYSNHGFVEEAIRKSLATDFKTKKFKRGGSTISMQLVKNAFLSRQKTIARKVEEIMIVWLIENNQLMTKDRMLEVYFNIIEWGRNVYGIGEAAHYYFDKTPAQLTLGESIYLASIVPNPKAGLYAFLPDGSLRPGLIGYFNQLGGLMASRGKTTVDSTGYGFYKVRLKESLRQKVKLVDSSMIDSLMKQSNEDAIPVITETENKPSFFQKLFARKDSIKKVPANKQTDNSDKQNFSAEIEKLRDEEKRKELQLDTSKLTRKEIRQERRRLREEEKQQEKELKEKTH
jgi:hypothetical protein